MFGIQTADQKMAWWGARAIFTNRVIDLLPDRMNTEGEEAEIEKLCKWLNKTGLAKLRKLVKSEGIWPEDNRQVRYEDDKYVIVANPRESCGYLYIGAWRKMPA